MFDPVTSGVHMFGSIPNGRSPVKTVEQRFAPGGPNC
jgi:hypothetical protein